jgi:hypothetical protein
LLRRVSHAAKSSETKSTFMPARRIASATMTQSVLVTVVFPGEDVRRLFPRCEA